MDIAFVKTLQTGTVCVTIGARTTTYRTYDEALAFLEWLGYTRYMVSGVGWVRID
jgi:hypothetical protein